MPANRRQYLLRYADQMHNDYDRLLENCKRISETYADLHPEHARFFNEQALVLIEMQAILKEFRTNFM